MRVELVSQPQYESLVDLLCELHTYYNEGSFAPPEMVSSYLVDTLLASDSPLRLVVAIDAAERVVGFAAISLTYSLVEPAPSRRRHCWLKELYVRSSRRSAGVGKALMAWIAQHALDNGCCRIDWPVKATNARGIAFYESLGAERVAERLSYRLSEPNLGRLGRPLDHMQMPSSCMAGIDFRVGQPPDALCVGVLATQVFLDTYATAGIEPKMAREVLAGYAPEAFEKRLSREARVFLLAERAGRLVAFSEIAFDRPCPLDAEAGPAELVRLYVQSPFQAKGIGGALLERAERLVVQRGFDKLWLSAWSGNRRALLFYKARAYSEIGAVGHVIHGETHENRVFVKKLPSPNGT